MKRVKSMVSALTFLYPVILLSLKNTRYFKVLALSLGAILIVSLMIRLPRGRRLIFLGMLISIALAMAILGLNNMERLYPFLMSASMLTIFASSTEPEGNPMIGPMRRRILADPQLLYALQDARWIWIVGLTVNTLILGVLLFAFGLDVWLLYAGFYSYLLLVLLFVLTLAFVTLRRRRIP